MKKEDKPTIIILAENEAVGSVSWILPDDVADEILALPAEEREAYLAEISDTTVETLKTLATIILCRKVFRAYKAEFERVLKIIRMGLLSSTAKKTEPKEPTKRILN